MIFTSPQILPIIIMNPGATLAYALSGHCGRSTRARPPVLSHLRSSHYDLLSAQEHSRAATYYSQRETRTQRVQCTFAASAAHPRTFAAMPHRCILGTRATVGLGQCTGYIVLTYPRPIEQEGTRCSPLFPDPHVLRVHGHTHAAEHARRYLRGGPRVASACRPGRSRQQKRTHASRGCTSARSAATPRRASRAASAWKADPCSWIFFTPSHSGAAANRTGADPRKSWIGGPALA